jgi:hypothetical protein
VQVTDSRTVRRRTLKPGLNDPNFENFYFSKVFIAPSSNKLIKNVLCGRNNILKVLIHNSFDLKQNVPSLREILYIVIFI